MRGPVLTPSGDAPTIEPAFPIPRPRPREPRPMSRQQDLLFCKIAITSGKVTQEDAQKCLAIANRLEAEGRDRPQVGVIFFKKNLLAGDDVQRIYGAVKKRLAAQ